MNAPQRRQHFHLPRLLRPPAVERRPAYLTLSAGLVSLGAVAFGALAIGALAIGTLAIGQLALGRARIRKLEIDELTVRRLTVLEPEPPPTAEARESSG